MLQRGGVSQELGTVRLADLKGCFPKPFDRAVIVDLGLNLLGPLLLQRGLWNTNLYPMCPLMQSNLNLNCSHKATVNKQVTLMMEGMVG